MADIAISIPPTSPNGVVRKSGKTTSFFSFSVPIKADVKRTAFCHTPTRGFQLIYCDIDQVDCTSNPDEWEFLLSLLSVEERDKVERFRQVDDRRRSFLSIQLQRFLIRQYLSSRSDNTYEIRRTAENKPYALSTTRSIGTWNYNVSHHGKYVAISSHSRLAVGLDVMTLYPTGMVCPEEEYFGMFNSHFTEQEMSIIMSEPTATKRYRLFFLNWSLKEAFVKATGTGITVPLKQVEFTIIIDQDGEEETEGEKEDAASVTAAAEVGAKGILCHIGSDLDSSADTRTRTPNSSPTGTPAPACTPGQGSFRGHARLRLQGLARTDWQFDFFNLDSDHVMSLARGPLEDVIMSYKSVAWQDGSKNEGGDDDVDDDHWESLRSPVPPCKLKSLMELLSHNNSARWRAFTQINTDTEAGASAGAGAELGVFSPSPYDDFDPFSPCKKSNGANGINVDSDSPFTSADSEPK